MQGDKLAPRWTDLFTIAEVRQKGVFRKALVNATLIKPYKTTRWKKTDDTVSTVTIISTAAPETVTFNSLNGKWQENRAEILGLKISKTLQPLESRDISEHYKPAFSHSSQDRRQKLIFPLSILFSH